jgi:hypothetical protein
MDCCTPDKIGLLRWRGVPTANPRRLTGTRESVDTLPDEGYLRVDLVCPDRSSPVAGRVGSRSFGSRHQLNVLRRKCPKRVLFSNIDRVVFAGLYRLAPGVLDALKILKPETVIGWHRADF